MRQLPIHQVFLLGAMLLAGLASAPAAGADETSALVSTAAVEQRTMTDALEAYGTLDPDPDQVLSLSLPHAGLINRVWVRLGQRVASGDRLLEVVTAPDARTQYLQAQSAVDFARRELARQQRLLEQQLATRAQLDAAQKNLQDAMSSLQALKKRGLDVAEETLRAPMDGIITRLDVSQGQRVQADTTAMLVAAEQRLIARLGVEPEDLAVVRVGAPVTITPVFVPEASIETTVREVHAMIDPGTQLVEVLAAIPEHQVDPLVLGSRVRGRIQLAAHTSLAVPRSAILTRGSDVFLYTVANGRAHRVAVQAGPELDDMVAVSGALQAGDRVVVSGNYELVDGMAVREAH